jgi:hypothetical protein
MVIFSHIEHISHKYPTNVKLLLNWPYFHTLSIFHTNIQWKLNFHSIGHISHIEHISHKYSMKVKFSLKWSYFHTLSIFYTIILLLSIVLFVFFWNSWLFYGGHCTSMVFHLSMVFLAWSSRWWKEEFQQIDQTLLIDIILNSDDSMFSRHNHLKPFVSCVYNMEHLSNVFC